MPGRAGRCQEIHGEDVGMAGVGWSVHSGCSRGETPNPPSGGKGD